MVEKVKHKAILNYIAAKEQVDSELTEYLITHMLKSVSDCMKLKDRPSILIQGFGRYVPSRKNMSQKFSALKKRMENPRNTDLEFLTVTLNTAVEVLEVFLRISDERQRLERFLPLKDKYIKLVEELKVTYERRKKEIEQSEVQSKASGELPEV